MKLVRKFMSVKDRSSSTSSHSSTSSNKRSRKRAVSLKETSSSPAATPEQAPDPTEEQGTTATLMADDQDPSLLLLTSELTQAQQIQPQPLERSSDPEPASVEPLQTAAADVEQGVPSAAVAEEAKEEEVGDEEEFTDTATGEEDDEDYTESPPEDDDGDDANEPKRKKSKKKRTNSLNLILSQKLEEGTEQLSRTTKKLAAGTKKTLDQIGVNPIKADGQHNVKVKGEGTDRIVTSFHEYAVEGFSVLTIVSAVVCMSFMVNQVSDSAALLTLLLSILTFWQKTKLKKLSNMRSKNNQLRRRIILLKDENGKMETSVASLQTQKERLQQSEATLQEIATTNKCSLDRLMFVVHENDQMQGEIKQMMNDEVLKPLFSAAVVMDGRNNKRRIRFKKPLAPVVEEEDAEEEPKVVDKPGSDVAQTNGDATTDAVPADPTTKTSEAEPVPVKDETTSKQRNNDKAKKYLQPVTAQRVAELKKDLAGIPGVTYDEQRFDSYLQPEDGTLTLQKLVEMANYVQDASVPAEQQIFRYQPKIFLDVQRHRLAEQRRRSSKLFKQKKKEHIISTSKKTIMLLRNSLNFVKPTPPPVRPMQPLVEDETEGAEDEEDGGGGGGGDSLEKLRKEMNPEYDHHEKENGTSVTTTTTTTTTQAS